jgi:hypothetical protein
MQNVPPGRHAFKYLVDGEWKLSTDYQVFSRLTPRTLHTTFLYTHVLFLSLFLFLSFSLSLSLTRTRSLSLSVVGLSVGQVVSCLVCHCLSATSVSCRKLLVYQAV